MSKPVNHVLTSKSVSLNKTNICPKAHNVNRHTKRKQKAGVLCQSAQPLQAKRPIYYGPIGTKLATRKYYFFACNSIPNASAIRAAVDNLKSRSPLTKRSIMLGATPASWPSL
jgi:hypothetical protein